MERVLRERLRPARYAATAPLDVAAWTVPGEPVPVAAALAATYEPMPLGSPWGAPWSTSWLRVTGAVPPRLGRPPGRGWWSTSASPPATPGFQAEALAYDLTGRPIKGIAPRNAYVPVDRSRGRRLLLEAAANPDRAGQRLRSRRRRWGSRRPPATPRSTGWPRWSWPCWTSRPGSSAWTSRCCSSSCSRCRRPTRAGTRSCGRWSGCSTCSTSHDVAGTAAAARKALADPLGPARARERAPALRGRPRAHRLRLAVAAAGDRRKCARTFANVTALAADYPELVFACSQAQQYAWVKEDQPGAVRPHQADASRVDSGRRSAGCGWSRTPTCPAASRWPASWCTASRFFRDEFGVDTREVWLPDSFGYTAAFPQLARLAGVRWFLTQKLSWNETNRLPHHTFRWEGHRRHPGLHPLPAGGHLQRRADRGRAGPRRGELRGEGRRHPVAGAVRVRRRRRRPDPGDAGAGPPAGATWRARRGWRSSRRRRSSPRPRPSTRTRRSGPASCTSSCTAAPSPPGRRPRPATGAASTCCGRPSCGRRPRPCATGAPVPVRRAGRLWKTVLLHQFHDILPGSSIGWVHREAVATHARGRRAAGAAGRGGDRGARRGRVQRRAVPAGRGGG